MGDLSVKLGGESRAYDCAEAVMERRLGGPVRWRFLLPLSLTDGGTFDEVWSMLDAGPVRAEPFWKGDTSLFPAAADELRPLVIAAEDAGPGRLWLSAVASFTDAERDAHTPRRRALRGDNLDSIVNQLANVAFKTDSATGELRDVKFADGGHAFVIQDGETDWQLLRRLLAQFRVPQAKPGDKPAPARDTFPVLTGAVGAQAAGRWVINWNNKAAYEAMQEVRERTLAEDDVFEIDDAEYPKRSCVADAGVDDGGHPVLRRTYERGVLDAALLDRWQTWRQRDAPLFTQDQQRMVWRVRDRFIAKGTATWLTDMDTLPQGASLEFALPQPTARPWRGVGTVSKTTPRGPWIEVRIPGFEDGFDALDARLTTAYSGTNGLAGLHLTPEEGTEVLLIWPGRPGAPVLCVGNVRPRDKDTAIAAPSLQLEADHTLTMQLNGVKVDSALALDVRDKARIESKGDFELTGGGATAKLSGGRMKVGGA